MKNNFANGFRRSPCGEPPRRGLLRNAAIVLGNIGDVDSLRNHSFVALRDDEIDRAKRPQFGRFAKSSNAIRIHRDFENAIQELTRLSLQRKMTPSSERKLDPGVNSTLRV